MTGITEAQPARKILIIEDEYAISELIKLNLDLAGYEICQAMDGEEGLKQIKHTQFDLVILDIMLPKMDGYALMPLISDKNIPIILLTARDGLHDKVRGLNMGADDYITKPFEGIELLARVRAVLRRHGKEKEIKGFDDIQILSDGRKVLKSGEEVELTPKEYDLLEVLVKNQGIALSREKLLELVWDYHYEGNTRTVDMHIQKLRSKLGTGRISTVFKIGYRLER